MFLLVLIVVPVVEVFVFIEVAHAIGWLLAVALLLGTSVLGVRLLRVQCAGLELIYSQAHLRDSKEL